MRLRALVIGAGWAGEGHTMALRSAGAEVVAACGRSDAPARTFAARLDIPEVRLDWRSAIAEFRPDIVAIATPAASHTEMAVAAAAAGCHILCDKPLAVNASGAASMLEAVEHAGVKHAYAPASCLSPAITVARDLVADGLIGTLTGVESTHHAGWGLPRPYSWMDDLNLGGGALNNLFTHKLAQVLRVTGGTPASIAGEARNFRPRVPVGARVHDFRELFRPLTGEEVEAMPWRPADADTSYSVIMELGLPLGPPISARFDGSATARSRTAATLVIYGLRGTLMLTGGNEMSPRELHHYDYGRDSWIELPVPADTTADLVQQDWNVLAKRFAEDIRREAHDDYPTFEDGWLASAIIDMVRDRPAKRNIPAIPPPAAS